MATKRYSVKESSEASLTVLASNFHYAIIPLRREAAKAIKEFKEAHPKASHYPYAFSYEGKVGYSDDGEPSGVAGLPYLDLIKYKNLDDVLLICARYFGGSKLGVGRLKRTFYDGITLALEKASLAEIRELYVYSNTVSFERVAIIENFLRGANVPFELEINEANCSLTFYSDGRIIESSNSPLEISQSIKIGVRKVYL